MTYLKCWKKKKNPTDLEFSFKKSGQIRLSQANENCGNSLLADLCRKAYYKDLFRQKKDDIGLKIEIYPGERRVSEEAQVKLK